MIKSTVVLLLTALLAIEANDLESKINLYSLQDEATVVLEELREVARSTIQQSYNDLAVLTNDAKLFRSNSFWYGEIDIRDTYKNITGEVTTIKDLAETEGADISSCLADREELLGQLANYYVDQLTECLIASNIEITDIVNDARYLVSVIINRVHELEFQLSLCAPDSIICISPVLQQIDLQMVQLPQKVDEEVNNADKLFEAWKVTVKTCTDSKIAAADSAGNAVLVEISQCANGIIG